MLLLDALLGALLLAGCEAEAPPATVVGLPAASPAETTASPAAEQVVAEVAEGLDEGLVNPGYTEKPDWFVNSFLDIREDVAEAAAANKRVILYFYQDGCPYCKKLLDTNLSQRATVEKLRSRFNVIAINMWGDREVTDFAGAATTEKVFARALRVMFTPTLLFLNEAGEVALRVNGYYAPHKFDIALDYAAVHNGSGPSFHEYYAGVAPSPASGKLHTADARLTTDRPLDRRDGERPLLVFFEQKDCTPCDELHLDVLQRPESREQLARFDTVLIDMWSQDPVQRPDGKNSSAAEWARELDVKYAPSLVFFNSAGEEVFRIEAYLRSFHVQSVMDYVASGAYLEQPSFQRFIAARADELEARGIHVDLMD
ncbi:MAG: thioredoxin fold domain-containing protein [Halobacteria archaeon]|nr:thioredoxin fold domain-containing protein [Halobacteria archaeon]